MTAPSDPTSQSATEPTTETTEAPPSEETAAEAATAPAEAPQSDAAPAEAEPTEQSEPTAEAAPAPTAEADAGAEPTREPEAAADAPPADAPDEAADAPEASTDDTAGASADDTAADDTAADDTAASESTDEDDEDDDEELPEGQVESSPEATPDPKAEAAPKKKKKKKKPSGPDPREVTKRIGTTSVAALAYVSDPDPQLSRMARKHREAIITEIPPVTAGALLGPDALCRHFLASAASGRYQDLFHLWSLFTQFPDQCKPVLASRQKAQEKAKHKLKVATQLGLLGDADRVASDITKATGLPWRWMKDILEPMGPAIRQRPQVMAAMVAKVPDFPLEIPDEPSDRWLAEAAALRESGADVPAEIDAQLGQHVDRLPATIANLTLAHAQYTDKVPALIDRVDLDDPHVPAVMAWARDHGYADQLLGRVNASVEEAASRGRAEGLAAWKMWSGRGVDVALPDSVAVPSIEGLDLGKPETAELLKTLVDGGADLDPQKILDDVAADNKNRGETAYEAFVCAGFDEVHLPLVLEGNPIVRQETRCPGCQAWTWVRPGHENRSPRADCKVQAPAPEQTAAATAATVDAAVAALAPSSSTPAASSAPTAPVERPSAPPVRPSSPPPAAPAPAAAPEAAAPEATAPEPAAPEAAPQPTAPDAGGSDPVEEAPAETTPEPAVATPDLTPSADAAAALAEGEAATDETVAAASEAETPTDGDTTSTG